MLTTIQILIKNKPVEYGHMIVEQLPHQDLDGRELSLDFYSSYRLIAHK